MVIFWQHGPFDSDVTTSADFFRAKPSFDQPDITNILVLNWVGSKTLKLSKLLVFLHHQITSVNTPLDYLKWQLHIFGRVILLSDAISKNHPPSIPILTYNL
jgi:hypothetical protein